MNELFASELFRKYAARLQRVAEVRLAADLRSKVSPEDVVQSAFKSFFRRLHEYRFDDADADGVWALLLIIAIRKCNKWDDLFRADKRNVGRETQGNLQNGQLRSHEFVESEPGPEEVIAVTDLIETLMNRFPSRQQEMLLLRIQGFELLDIAQKCRSSRRTVARVIADAKDVLQSILAESEFDSKESRVFTPPRAY